MTFRLKSIKFSEHDGHKQLATWLGVVKLQTKSFTYHSSPNGLLSKNLIGKAKSEGMRPGWPDMQLHFKDGRTVFFELKLTKTPVNVNQKAIHYELRGLGYDVHIIRHDTPNECIDRVRDVLNGEYGMKISI